MKPQVLLGLLPCLVVLAESLPASPRPSPPLRVDHGSGSPIDGVYAFLDPGPPQWWSCLRCADYRPTGGAWRLTFSDGVMTLSDEVTGWSSHASFDLDGGNLLLSDDPVCPWDLGRYAWALEPNGLLLSPISDDCSFGLRALNLGRGIWTDCRPPDLRAAASDAWPRPEACPRPAEPVSTAPELPEGLAVTVRPGDARMTSTTLQAIPANAMNVASPAGVDIRSHPEVVRYGLYLVLWRGAPWVEASFTAPAGPIGVQFWGPSTMGSARLLLDGLEVWRGQPADLGELRSQYGGYVEVSGLPPGPHSLRVERLDRDTRPIRVMFFGTG